MAKHTDKKQEEVEHGNVISADETTKQLEAAQKEVEEMKTHYLRALADYKNLENRVSNEREQMRDSIKRQVVEQFLPVVDNIDQAEIFTSDPGLKMIGNSLRQVLRDLGVKEVELLDNEYDPHSAEVIEAVEGDEDNKVVEVVQKAYELNGNVIRPGRVKVSKRS